MKSCFGHYSILRYGIVSMFSNLIWKLVRLKAMDGSELVYRFGQAAQATVEKFIFRRTLIGDPVGPCGNAWSKEFPIDLNVDVYRAAADRILAGRFDVFAMRNAALGFPPNWNQDPKTRTVVPLVFGKTLNYRDERIVGDIKYLWEPNRHLELVTLAQSWQLTGELKYLEGCKTLLDSWFEQCPYPMGVNWVSSLELSVRLVNWSFAWHLLGGDKSPLFSGIDGAEFRNRWLRFVFQHCHFIAGHFSRYSSANNHLLGEYMGLMVGTLTWPMWSESANWKRTAVQGFETEALRQNGPDGVNREQAVYYQYEVMDMMVLCGLIGRANGVEFNPAFWQCLEHLMEFLASVMDCAGNVQMIGDADDALMVRLSQETYWSNYRSMLATGAVLFKRGDLAVKACRFDDKSRWLIGDAAAKVFATLSLPISEKPRMNFSEGGYYLLGARFGAADEVRALVDCGPLGYLSIAAHGHADALSLVLSAGGHELLIDPGTYAYHTQKKWRNYFRGTGAHNTVRVDGVDQSKIGGNFLWLRKANSHCDLIETTGEYQQFSGWHDGYHRLQDPVTHQRNIEFSAIKNSFNVIDLLRCQGHHSVELSWHFAENCSVTCDGTNVNVTIGSVRLAMYMSSAALKPVLHHGEEVPPLGWISRAFDVKSPTTTVVWSGAIQGNTSLGTTINIYFDR